MAKSKQPPKNGDEGLDDVFSFRMTLDERAILERLAKNDRRSPSNFLRKLIADENARSKTKR